MEDVLEDEIPPTPFEQTLKHFVKYLGYRDLINVIEVSKSGTTTVDNYLEPHFDNDPDGHHVAQVNAYRIYNLYSNRGHLLPRANPAMMYKAIWFRFNATEDPDEYRASVYKQLVLLQKHGKCTRWIDIVSYSNGLVFMDSEDRWMNFKYFLFLFLECTPNLRRLTIKHCTNEQPQNTDDYLLPHLFHLNSIDLCTDDKTVAEFIVDKYGPQLVSLSITDMADVHNPIEDINLHWYVPEYVVLAQLQKLSVRIISMTYSDHFARLVALQQFQLKTLTVKFGSYNEDYVLHMVCHINHFQSGLEELIVSNHAEYNLDYTSTNIANTYLGDLRLPNAKRLELNWVGFPSTTLLTTMTPALEKLVLKTRQEQSTMNSNEDLKMYERLYEQQEFWESCPPTLKSVHVCVQYSGMGCSVNKWYEKSYLYNRDMAEYIQKINLDNFVEVVPSLIRYLGNRDLVNVIEIAKPVSKAVDEHLEPLYDDKQDRPDFVHDTAHNIFKLYSNIGHMCPWINPVMMYKAVFFHFDPTEDPDEYQKYASGTLQFLEKHGERIRWLDIEYYSKEDNLNEYERLLSSVLTRTPKLQRLSITLCTDVQPQPEPQQINLDILPNLARLKSIEITATEQQAIETIVHKYGSQLTNLSITDLADVYINRIIYRNQPRNNLLHHWHVPEFMVLSHLQKLKVCILSSTYAYHLTLLFERQPFHLKKLEIEFGNYSNVELVIAMIDNFQPGLEELILTNCGEHNSALAPTQFNHDVLPKLSLPNLTRLEIHWLRFSSAMLLKTLTPVLEKLVLDAKIHLNAMNNYTELNMYKRLYEQPTFWETCPPTLKSVQVRVRYSQVCGSRSIWYSNDETYLYNRNMFDYLQKNKPSGRAGKRKLVRRNNDQDE